jgi:hypothetical protein
METELLNLFKTIGKTEISQLAILVAKLSNDDKERIIQDLRPVSEKLSIVDRTPRNKEFKYKVIIYFVYLK